MSSPACYVTQTAPPVTVAWVARVLGPVTAACLFDKPPPVELRPTGRFSGYCQLRSVAADGRVAISKQVCFWTEADFIDVYLHEAAHRLIIGREVLDHGPEFFALNLTLMMRAQALFERDVIELMGLYDCRDCPAELIEEPNWRGIVLNWAIPVAAELAATDASAEALSSTVCERWKQHLQDREQSRIATALQAVVARKAASAMRQQVSELKSSVWLWRALSGAGWFFFLLVGYVVL